MLISILDFIVTFFWLYGLWIMLIAIFAGFFCMFFVEDLKIKLPSKVFLGITIVFVVMPFVCYCFLNFINPYFFGLGYATDNFEVIAQEDNILWTMDYWFIGDGGETGGNSSIVYRIEGINLDNGNKLFRKLVENQFETLGHNNHFVWALSGKDLLGIDLISGKTKIIINEKNLMKNFPKLVKGVYKYDFNPKTFLIDIISKDGLQISIDPINNKKIDHPIENKILEQPDLENHSISENYQRIIALSDDISQKLIDKNSKILNNDLSFLAGKFLLYDKSTEKVLILSYETLDKNNFILRNLSLQGNLLWEIKQNNLKVSDFLSPNPRFEKAFFYKNQIIMVFYGFVFSLNTSDGHLNWLTRV